MRETWIYKAIIFLVISGYVGYFKYLKQLFSQYTLYKYDNSLFFISVADKILEKYA